MYHILSILDCTVSFYSNGMLEAFKRVGGPAECIDDHVESKYFDNLAVGTQFYKPLLNAYNYTWL